MLRKLALFGAYVQWVLLPGIMAIQCYYNALRACSDMVCGAI